MRVTIQAFSVLRDLLGFDVQEVDVEEGLTVGALYQRLLPAAAPQSDHLTPLFAVGQEYVLPSTPLRDGDEVVFLPPLGGG